MLNITVTFWSKVDLLTNSQLVDIFVLYVTINITHFLRFQTSGFSMQTLEL